MYISTIEIWNAIKRISSVHTFMGITFLTCKKINLPVEDVRQISLDNETKKFMDDIHKVCPDSSYYFQPYKTIKEKDWVNGRYPSTGLQKGNTSTFKNAFIHESGSKVWGWDRNYVSVISKILKEDNRSLIPLLEMAIWVLKTKNWNKKKTISADDIIDRFIEEYNLSPEELQTFFDCKEHGKKIQIKLSETITTWNELKEYIILPPDAKPDREGTLSFLSLQNVGPVKKVEMHFAPRINIITGDNGLGKTFIMDSVWWALTNKWIEDPILPRSGKIKGNSEIIYEVSGRAKTKTKQTIVYDKKQKKWKRDEKTPTIPGLIIYVRVDGSYAVWDPIKQYSDSLPKAFLFSNYEIWYGKYEGKTRYIDGLLNDWIRWQEAPEKYPFHILEEVLKSMSPPDLGQMKTGTPIRDMESSREIPTVIHPYGEIPIINTSAGIKRIITMAYLIVWSWYEHKENAKALEMEANSRIVLMIDEIEAHLHPKWQRTIIPALLSVQKILQKNLEIEYIFATHSPLVLASTEPIFNKQQDILYHMELSEDAQDVDLEPIPFYKRGTVNAWLTSSIFNMRQARSQEAEVAIEEAKKLQEKNKCTIEEVKEVNFKLLNSLAQDDLFWPRWLFFAERNGIDI